MNNDKMITYNIWSTQFLSNFYFDFYHKNMIK